MVWSGELVVWRWEVVFVVGAGGFKTPSLEVFEGRPPGFDAVGVHRSSALSEVVWLRGSVYLVKNRDVQQNGERGCARA